MTPERGEHIPAEIKDKLQPEAEAVLSIKSLAEGIEGKRQETFDEKTGVSRLTIENDNELILYARHSALNDPTNPEGGLRYDYEKAYEYDDGHRIKEVGQDMNRVNAWESHFVVDAVGEMKSERGEITAGEDQGHKWEKRFLVFVAKDGSLIKLEVGTILAQGNNQRKELTGHGWKQILVTRPDGKEISGGFRITAGGPEKPVGPWGQWDEVSKYEAEVK